MKSPFWSSDKKAWKASNGFVNLDTEPIIRSTATPPKQDSTSVTISNNYATLAQAERAATMTEPSSNAAEAHRKTVEHARQKRNRYHDRKFLVKPTTDEDIDGGQSFSTKDCRPGVRVVDEEGRTVQKHGPCRTLHHRPSRNSSTNSSDKRERNTHKVSLRNADTISLHSIRRPVVPQRPSAIIASASTLGPLSQWQLTGENYIDSEQRKRHRAAIGNRRSDDHVEPPNENRRMMYNGPHGTWETSHSGESSSTSSTPNLLTLSMADVEKPLRKPREERSTVFDRTVRIPRKKLVLDGPLHSTSYAHWNSQVFPGPEAD